MKLYEYAVIALVLLDAIMGTDFNRIMVADSDQESGEGMTPEERSAVIIGLIIALIACAIVCYLRITNQIVCTPNTI